jgi:hypothetical protein
MKIEYIKQNEISLLFENSGQKQACIGYLRGDFGKNGKEFWSTWFDIEISLKTKAFNFELDNIVNGLRVGELLKNRATMANYCITHPASYVLQAMREFYAFRIDTKEHRYYLRCFPYQGDYNFYLMCYRTSALKENPV